MEEIIENSSETEILFQIAGSIARIRNRDELFGELMSLIKPVFNNADSAIFVIEKNGEHYRLWHDTLEVEYTEGSKSREGDPIPLKNNPVAEDCFLRPIHILKKEEMLRLSIHNQLITQWVHESKVEEVLVLPLHVRGQCIGSLNFHSGLIGNFKQEKFSFYKAIGDQLAVAISNILSYEDILEREREKSLLLTFSEDMASIRDRNSLWAVMMDKIKPLIKFSDAVVIVFDEPLNKYQHYLTVSPLERMENENYEKIVGNWLPLEGSPIEHVLTLGSEYSWNIDEIQKLYPSDPGVILCIDTGLNYCLGFQLIWNKRVLGILQIAFNTQEQWDKSKIPFLRSIAQQTTLAIANILANEEIIEREREKTVLLSLSEDMASIRVIQDLWRVMMDKIRPLIGFSDAVVIVYSEDQSKSKTILTLSVGNRTEKDWYQYIHDQWIPISAPLREVYSLGTAYWSTEKMLAKWPGFKGFEFMLSEGLTDTYQLVLRHGGKEIGLLLLHFNKKEIIIDNKYQLYKSLADQIAIAVANICAYEEIVEREKEKSILLYISEAIATIRDKKELLKLFFEKVKPFFNFYNTGFFVFKSEKKIIEDWTVLIPTLSPSESNYLNSSNNSGSFLFKDSALEEYYQQLCTSKGPLIVYSNDELFEKFLDYPQGEGIKEAGYKESMGTLLRTDTGDLGILFFNSIKENHFNSNHFSLFQGIADLLAAAVQNILANEEIIEREKEKDQLLTINQGLSSIQNVSDLLTYIYEKLKPIFKFDYGVITLYSQDLQFIRHIDSNGDGKEKELIEYKNLFNNRNKVDGSPYELFLRNNSPIIYQSDLLFKAYPNHDGVKILNQLGIVEHVNMLLCFAGQVLGTFELHYCKTGILSIDQIPLFTNLSNQISVALANILSIEEILEREKEKALLLNLANSISNISDKNELWDAVVDHLEPVFKFIKDFTFINLFSFDKQFYKLYLLNKEVLGNKNLAFGRVYGKLMPVKGNPIEQIFNKKVWIFNVRDLREEYPNFWGLMESQKHGGNQIVIIRLEHGGNILGTLHFNAATEGTFTETQVPLLEAIGKQVSIALANMLATEELLERDKEKSLQIDAINALTSNKEREIACLNLAEVIFKSIPFHTISIAVPFDIDYLLGFKMGEDGALKKWDNVGDISSAAGITVDQYQMILSELVASGYFSLARICKGDEHDSMCRDFELFRLHNLYEGINSALYVPFFLKGQTLSLHIYLTSKERDGFKEEQLLLLKNIISPVSLALENIFAFEDIDQREKEKSLLLKLSNSIASIKEKGELWEALVNHLHPILNFEKEYTFVFLLTPDKEHYRYFLVKKEALANPTLPFNDSLKHVFPIKGFPYEQVINKSVWIFNIKDLQMQYPDFQGFKGSLKNGIKSTAIIRLQHAGEVIGSLHFNSCHEDFFKPNQIPLLESIGKQLSIAIANVLANEEIENKMLEIKALQKQLEVENEYLQEAVDQVYNYSEIIGTSKEMQNVYQLVSQVASTDSTVLILGETGTGKELIARAIHNSSSRKDKLLVKVNCASLPANLIESELFGHERGSFTGAFEKRIGKFELAHKGTLFLDEIGELPVELQAKLLRALQEKEIERIGGKSVIKCDVRIIAATNRKLDEEVKAQRFRSDLFFRLNIFPIKLPTLRERREDIPLLANHFLLKFSKKMNKRILGIDRQSLQTIMTYSWPGNIRELENVIERAVIINKTKLLSIDLAAYQNRNSEADTISSTLNNFQIKSYKDSERELILKALEVTNGKIRGEGGAAQLLKINPTTLESKMKKLGLVKRNRVELKED